MTSNLYYNLKEKVKEKEINDEDKDNNELQTEI